MTLRGALERTKGGRGLLAGARLRRRVLQLMEEALSSSGLSQADVARALGCSRSAVSQTFGGDGNLRIDTLAEYLDALGYEAEVIIRPRGSGAGVSGAKGRASARRSG